MSDNLHKSNFKFLLNVIGDFEFLFLGFLSTRPEWLNKESFYVTLTSHEEGFCVDQEVLFHSRTHLALKMLSLFVFVFALSGFCSFRRLCGKRERNFSRAR